ncbi:DUF4258 domain-containing protein [Candidatus Woesearchaeota archaeon]|nr:DUF4258 domain-containing protein [Candidatus Woesearchaeota archaeon]
MDIKLNIAFRNIKGLKDSDKRSDHILDRMQLRGIGREQIIEAIQKGSKCIRNDGSIISEYRWFKVIYREFAVENVKKIYPITVMEI